MPLKMPLEILLQRHETGDAVSRGNERPVDRFPD
jgi:hypothetical protein